MNDTTPTLKFSLSWRTLALIMLAVIAVMLFFWKPWQPAGAVRTISVQGQATVSAVPDMYSFQPVFTGSDVKSVTAVGNDAVAQLKKLGVKDADLKTTVSASGATKPSSPAGAPNIMIYPTPDASAYYSITATVRDKAVAQKISDYLATTTATGQIAPMATFSKDTQTKLDLDARSKASDDAKAKADVTAKQLGARVGRVVKITDISTPWIYPGEASGGVAIPQTAKVVGGPTIQPGTNEVSYSFTVEFELK